MANLKRDALKAIKSDGGSTSYYKLPKGATELNDLIEHKKMSFALGNCFKACYRLGEKEGADLLYDLNKIVFFANRMIDQEKKRQGGHKVGQVVRDGVIRDIVIAPKEKTKSVRDQWKYVETFNEPLQGNSPDDIAKRERLDKEHQKAWENFWNAAPKFIKPADPKPDPDLDLFAYWDESQMYRTEDK